MEVLIIIVVIIVTALTSVRAFNDRLLFDKLKFNASHTINSKEFYRLFSYGLVHADWIHLIVNMYVLFIFGKIVMVFFNALFGAMANMHFVIMYVLGIALSSIPSLIKHRNNYAYNAVGASGAVSAVVFSSIILYPQGEIGLLFIPIMMPSWVFGLLYLAYTVYMSKKNVDNIGHDAHFWGAVWGIVYTIMIDPEVVSRFFQSFA